MESPLPPPTGVQQIRVDIGSLTSFGTFMRRELDESLSPMMHRVTPALTNGNLIGTRLPSNDLRTLNARHGECLDAMTSQLSAYATALAVISDATHAIAQEYRTTDALAKASLDGIETPFATAQAQDGSSTSAA